MSCWPSLPLLSESILFLDSLSETTLLSSFGSTSPVRIYNSVSRSWPQAGSLSAECQSYVHSVHTLWVPVTPDAHWRLVLSGVLALARLTRKKHSIEFTFYNTYQRYWFYNICSLNSSKIKNLSKCCWLLVLLLWNSYFSFPGVCVCTCEPHIWT